MSNLTNETTWRPIASVASMNSVYESNRRDGINGTGGTLGGLGVFKMVWCIDFMRDSLGDGRLLETFKVFDDGNLVGIGVCFS
jgi:hypothetical protein